MPVLPILLPFVLLFVLYISQENLYHFRAATTLKVLLTVLLSVWILWSLLHEFSLPRLFGLIGMICAIWGDYYLQYVKSDNRKFVRGVIAFALTQVFYLISFHVSTGFVWTEVLCFLVFGAISGFFKLYFRWDTSEADPYLTIYTALITFTGAKACSLALLSGGNVWMLAAGIGGVLFYFSDMVLGIWSYQKQHILLADLNWLLYFSGQFLLAYGFVTY
jgi:uncharacterized membrane protein YhhN